MTKSQAAPRRRRWFWRLGISFSLALLLLGVAWWAVRNTTWFAPAMADGLRRVIGRDAVESLERLIAGARDRAKRALPPQRDSSSGYAELASAPTPTTSAEPEPTREAFRPADPGPMDPSVAAPKDGVWRVLVDPAVYTTLLHPDRTRPWSKLWAFAFDLGELRLHAVPGTVEPATKNPEAARTRTGLIPSEDQARLVAAFNGGFKAEHGHHGMFTQGVVLLPARESMCTIVGYEDGTVRVGTWSKLPTTEGLSWYRQTPPCMVEGGAMHRGLLVEKNRNWGATLEGEVVIPRSAVGLSADGKTLYFALSFDATPRIMADGMRHCGAVDIAQLDVNWPYPRLLLFPRDASGVANAASVVEGVPFHRDDYLRKPSKRDFFYVTRQSRNP